MPSLESLKRGICALPVVGKRLAPYAGLAHRPGFYYSPIPNLEEVRKDDSGIWRQSATRKIPGVELNEDSQLYLLGELKKFYAQQPFAAQKQPGIRYYFENDFFSYSDGLFYYSMLRHLRPKRVVEIGSGFSSCVALDTGERFLDSGVEFTFIDPDPSRLYSLLNPGDREKLRIIPKRLQEVDFAEFGRLAAGDILFIDSSHVSKTGSDVNLILFEVLPSLPSGVYIHIHDSFYPFEYPRAYVYKGWAWNELYAIRAFLSYNRDFSIALFPSFLELFHEESLKEAMPLVLQSPRGWPTIKGASLWMRRV